MIAPEVTPVVEELAAHDKIEWYEREYRAGDLAQAFIAIAVNRRR